MDLAKRINKLGTESGWVLREHQDNNRLLIFTKDTRQINVWYTKMTVGTLVNHPKQGRNMLYRRNVSLEELEVLFKNPRQHLGKGYRAATPSTYARPEKVYPKRKRASLGSRLRYLLTGKL